MMAFKLVETELRFFDKIDVFPIETIGNANENSWKSTKSGLWNSTNYEAWRNINEAISLCACSSKYAPLRYAYASQAWAQVHVLVYMCDIQTPARWITS